MASVKGNGPGAGKIRRLTDDVLDGFSLKDISCRSCSGYGNCGFKSYFISDDGVASVCLRTRKQLQCKRDGVPFSDDDPV